MQQITLECQTRPENSKPNALRREGFIPAVLYGHNGTESVSLTLSDREAQALLRKASVNNTLIDLNVSDLPWQGKVLIREVQAHPWKRTLYHLSFFSVSAHGNIEVVVPIHLVGQSVGLKQGGILEQILTEVKVQCLPDQIPESIDLDISGLEIGASVHVHELPVAQGVTIVDDPEASVISILAPSRAAQPQAEEAETEAIIS